MHLHIVDQQWAHFTRPFPANFAAVALRWVVTAAHCLERDGANPISPGFVRVGIRSNGSYEMILEVQPSALHIHPEFVGDRHLRDIGRFFDYF